MFTAERKGSKGSLTNADEIVADTQTTTATAAATTPVNQSGQASPPKVTTVYEENERTGETTDVSDKSK